MRYYLVTLMLARSYGDGKNYMTDRDDEAELIKTTKIRPVQSISKTYFLKTIILNVP